MCVNPLHVGELISTIVVAIIIVKTNASQSPSRRGTHFYLEFDVLRNTCNFLVNPLHVGELISTATEKYPQTIIN